MSDATEAWEKWYGNPDVASDTPSIAFAAGFAAGQVAALEDAADYADAVNENNEKICRCGHHKRRHNPTKEWCWACRPCKGFRARAAELKEQHDQPDP